ncbi:uncharacterized protein LOC118415721 [Branchiostoma floridae]|uniref:Uncharacterized protein LOC118415721 n=1 Tax=Branchiostoma floridae TaxID=7739 RepID=A0A9J7MRB0_BRAFL|nr:uncharacterized protein LOC118415721 [Branchiostoma floridae]
MNPPVLLLAAFVLKVLVSSPSGQAQTTVTDLIGNFQRLRNKSFLTVAPFRSYIQSSIEYCAEACLNSTSCLAFRWQHGITLFTNICNLYDMVEDPINSSDHDLYFKTLLTTTVPTIIPTSAHSTQPTTTQAKCVSIVGPEVLAAVTIATTVTGFVLGLITGVITSQLVQWYRSKAKENRNLRQADLEEENTDDGHSLPLPLTRTDQAGNVHVHYDVPTEGLSVRRPSS